MSRPGTRMTGVCKDELVYRMDHPRRGVAAVFNQEVFDGNDPPRRLGSEEDCKKLLKTFGMLGLEVEIYRNLSLAGIKERLNELSRRNHSDCDCFVLVFMSHGLEGRLMARNAPFHIHLLWDSFTTKACPSLANKPKVFIVQACQGTVRQGSVFVYADGRECVKLVPTYQLPKGPDFLLALASTPGFQSWRSHKLGSLYILTLCRQLNMFGFDQDLLTVLTRVAHSVALDHVHYECKTDTYMKQLPSIISLLSRKLRFTKCKGIKNKGFWGRSGLVSRDEEGGSGWSTSLLGGLDAGGMSRKRKRLSSEEQLCNSSGDEENEKLS